MYSFSEIEKHPNPIFYRNRFLCLDGEWQFAFDPEKVGFDKNWFASADFDKTIQVPFVYQSQSSGIHSSELCECVWYRRTVKLPKEFVSDRVLLCFAAVDYRCDVWVNGAFVGSHEGGYSSFSFDITHTLRPDADNVIVVRAEDFDFADELIRGKQLWSEGEFGCWYKRYTGIWQSVWLESVSDVHITKFITRPDIDENTVALKACLCGMNHRQSLTADIEVHIGDKEVAKASFQITRGYLNEKISVDYAGSPFRGSEWWSPEHPNLYQMLITVRDEDAVLDEVQTYFGMRKLEARGGEVLLNNFPFYMRSILNQGYYPQGYITPESDERIVSDIRLIKSAGYNAMRIHQKIESPRFLYWCDRIGIAAWEEIPSMYQFRELQLHQILNEITSIVERDINHPSIIAWVMFNESWGVKQIRFHKQQQHLSIAAYHAVKAMDPTRFVISNDGWQQTKTDLATIHDYAVSGAEIIANNGAPFAMGENHPAGSRRYAFADGFVYEGQPVMITEYGGISYASDEGWGYNGKVKTEKEFLERFGDLTAAVRRIDFVKGFCFTQFTDVENEQNGLFTIDRKPKVDIETVKKINLGIK